MKKPPSRALQRLIGLGAISTIAIYALALIKVPLFYDEGAFRRQFGRAFIDGFAQYSFFPVCSDPKVTPLLFTPAHAALSSLDELLSWAGVRIVPLLTLVLLVCVLTLLLRQVAPRTWGYGLAALCGGFVGLSGVGLLLSRWEFIATVHIVACLSTWLIAKRGYTTVSILAVVVILHLSVALVSLFVHPQGLLLVPLSLLTLFCLLRNNLAMFAVVLFAIAVLTLQALNYSQFRCPQDQELEDTIARTHGVVFSDQLSGQSLPVQVASRLWHFERQFFFQTREAFSIPVPQVPSSVAFVVNLPIAIVVGGQLLTLMAGSIWLLMALWREFVLRVRRRDYGGLRDLLCDGRALWLGGASLLVAYSISDVGGVFYRAHYRNLLTAVLLAIALAYVAERFPIIRRAALSTLAVTAISAAVTLLYITPQLALGYESYYVSTQRDWPAFNAQVQSLASKCNIKPEDGRIVVDMATYDALRKFPRPIDYNYVWYGDYLKGKFIADRSESQWLSYYKQFDTSGYVIMCRSLITARLPIQHRSGDLCCLKF